MFVKVENVQVSVPLRGVWGERVYWNGKDSWGVVETKSFRPLAGCLG
ncbi:hypothetical protein APA_1309 [Pseudanabaena sp. lw0831]|nr:hypothetical protein APA_1309 [Pseudanabaena sp. lw0831]